MPNLPAQVQPPYPTAEFILLLVRTLCLDNGISAAGDLLSDNATYTFTLLQSAYEYVQAELANRGYETPTKEAILLNITPVPAAALNPGTQVYIDYANYFDGLALNAAPVLPQDLLAPVRLWERPNGSLVRFSEMNPALDGLDSLPQYSYLRQWEWRDDKVYMIGATQAKDIRMRYQAYFPPLVAPGSVAKLFQGANAIAYTMAYGFSGPREGAVAQMFATERDAAIRQLASRITRKNQRRNLRPRPYGAMGARQN